MTDQRRFSSLEDLRHFIQFKAGLLGCSVDVRFLRELCSADSIAEACCDGADITDVTAFISELKGLKSANGQPLLTLEALNHLANAAWHLRPRKVCHVLQGAAAVQQVGVPSQRQPVGQIGGHRAPAVKRKRSGVEVPVIKQERTDCCTAAGNTQARETDLLPQPVSEVPNSLSALGVMHAQPSARECQQGEQPCGSLHACAPQALQPRLTAPNPSTSDPCSSGVSQRTSRDSSAGGWLEKSRRAYEHSTGYHQVAVARDTIPPTHDANTGHARVHRVESFDVRSHMPFNQFSPLCESGQLPCASPDYPTPRGQPCAPAEPRGAPDGPTPPDINMFNGPSIQDACPTPSAPRTMSMMDMDHAAASQPEQEPMGRQTAVSQLAPPESSVQPDESGPAAKPDVEALRRGDRQYVDTFAHTPQTPGSGIPAGNREPGEDHAVGLGSNQTQACDEGQQAHTARVDPCSPPFGSIPDKFDQVGAWVAEPYRWASKAPPTPVESAPSSCRAPLASTLTEQHAAAPADDADALQRSRAVDAVPEAAVLGHAQDGEQAPSVLAGQDLPWQYQPAGSPPLPCNAPMRTAYHPNDATGRGPGSPEYEPDPPTHKEESPCYVPLDDEFYGMDTYDSYPSSREGSPGLVPGVAGVAGESEEEQPVTPRGSPRAHGNHEHRAPPARVRSPSYCLGVAHEESAVELKGDEGQCGAAGGAAVTPAPSESCEARDEGESVHNQLLQGGPEGDASCDAPKVANTISFEDAVHFNSAVDRIVRSLVPKADYNALLKRFKRSEDDDDVVESFLRRSRDAAAFVMGCGAVRASRPVPQRAVALQYAWNAAMQLLMCFVHMRPTPSQLSAKVGPKPKAIEAGFEGVLGMYPELFKIQQTKGKNGGPKKVAVLAWRW